MIDPVLRSGNPLKISLEWRGCFLEHRDFFNAMAVSMQAAGHKVGILTGEREREYDYMNNLHDRRKEILDSLGFIPDFMYIWEENETIANGNLWKVQRMEREHIDLHFSSEAREMKKYTDKWIIKTMDSGQREKF